MKYRRARVATIAHLFMAAGAHQMPYFQVSLLFIDLIQSRGDAVRRTATLTE
jgi:hypothetical protein